GTLAKKGARAERKEFGRSQASANRPRASRSESSRRVERTRTVFALPSARKRAAGPGFARTARPSREYARRIARRRGRAITQSPSQLGATTSRPPAFTGNLKPET